MEDGFRCNKCGKTFWTYAQADKHVKYECKGERE